MFHPLHAWEPPTHFAVATQLLAKGIAPQPESSLRKMRGTHSFTRWLGHIILPCNKVIPLYRRPNATPPFRFTSPGKLETPGIAQPPTMGGLHYIFTQKMPHAHKKERNTRTPLYFGTLASASSASRAVAYSPFGVLFPVWWSELKIQ